MAMALYHEKQERLRCGIHALNNLMQTRMFDHHLLDDACMQLVQNAADPSTDTATTAPPTPAAPSLRDRLWNPHRSALGLGNYDVNVLMLVLQNKGFELQWTDKRKPITAESLDFDTIEGVLLNIVTLGGLFSRIGMEQRHWFAIKKIDGLCFNLDSKLPSPAAFAGDDDCRLFLQELLATGECELFIVRKTNN